MNTHLSILGCRIDVRLILLLVGLYIIVYYIPLRSFADGFDLIGVVNPGGPTKPRANASASTNHLEIAYETLPIAAP